MLKKRLQQYMWKTYRRKHIDSLLSTHEHLFSGVVLDIGGRDRGKFKKPKEQVKKWIFADINPAHNPDIVLDVSCMDTIENSSVDTILACELFEHVQQIDEGIIECFRVLKQHGRMIISVPFLYAIHADPSDYQRWTKYKWIQELEKNGFHVEECIITGRFFTLMAEYTKILFKSLPQPLSFGVLFLCPFLDLLVRLDRLPLIKNHPRLGNFHGGYFIVVTK